MTSKGWVFPLGFDGVYIPKTNTASENIPQKESPHQFLGAMLVLDGF